MVEVVGRVGRGDGNHPPVRGPARIGHGGASGVLGRCGASGAPGHFGRADGKHPPECGPARVSHGGASGRVGRPLLGGARQLPRRACLALLEDSGLRLEDLIGKEFPFEILLAMKMTTHHDLDWQ